jgi:hypothetical protein
MFLLLHKSTIIYYQIFKKESNEVKTHTDTKPKYVVKVAEFVVTSCAQLSLLGPLSLYRCALFYQFTTY